MMISSFSLCLSECSTASLTVSAWIPVSAVSSVSFLEAVLKKAISNTGAEYKAEQHCDYKLKYILKTIVSLASSDLFGDEGGVPVLSGDTEVAVVQEVERFLQLLLQTLRETTLIQVGAAVQHHFSGLRGISDTTQSRLLAGQSGLFISIHWEITFPFELSVTKDIPCHYVSW